MTPAILLAAVTALIALLLLASFTGDLRKPKSCQEKAHTGYGVMNALGARCLCWIRYGMAAARFTKSASRRKKITGQ